MPEGHKDDEFDRQEFQYGIIRRQQVFSGVVKQEEAVQCNGVGYVIYDCDVQVPFVWPKKERKGTRKKVV